MFSWIMWIAEALLKSFVLLSIIAIWFLCVAAMFSFFGFTRVIESDPRDPTRKHVAQIIRSLNGRAFSKSVRTFSIAVLFLMPLILIVDSARQLGHFGWIGSSDAVPGSTRSIENDDEGSDKSFERSDEPESNESSSASDNDLAQVMEDVAPTGKIDVHAMVCYPARRSIEMRLPTRPKVGASNFIDNQGHVISCQRLRKPRSRAGAALRWPVVGNLSSSFGVYRGERNDGIDIAGIRGEPVHAVAPGVIVYAGDELKGYGNLVIERQDNGFISVYAHLDSISIGRGDIVSAGMILGTLGNTGDVDRPVLHFEIRDSTRPLDPMSILGHLPRKS